MEVIATFERLLDRFLPPPEEAVERVRRGERHLRAGDLGYALKLAEGAIALAPTWLQARVLHADTLSALGRPWDALSVLSALEVERSLPPAVLARIASLAALVGDVTVALDAEARLRAWRQPTGADVAERLLAGSRALTRRGHETPATRLARGATRADPSCAGAWAVVSRAALTRGDRHRSRDAFDRAVATASPVDGQTNLLLGSLAVLHGEHEVAVRSLKRAWIVGELEALGPLVEALKIGGGASLESQLVSVDARTNEMVKIVGILGRSEGDIDQALTTITGAEITDALWPWALSTAWSCAPSVALRWARACPEREGSAAVIAVESPLRSDELVSELAPALGWDTTRERAREVLTEAWRERWSVDWVAMFDALAKMLRTSKSDSQRVISESFTELRRELDAPLRVMIAGEFSAGKSTFVNALVGSVVSPMGVLPTTARVHWLRQGGRVARIVERGGVTIECAIEDAPTIEARRSAEGVEIDHVEVCLPTHVLGHIEFIDTPGTNAGDSSDTLDRAVELSDIALWVFDARQAGKESELAALRVIHAGGVAACGILNKADRVSVSERREIVAALSQSPEVSRLAPCVVALSARGALEGRGEGEGDREAIDWLINRQLAGQRARWKRARVAARALLLIERVAAERRAVVEAEARRSQACEALVERVAILRASLHEAGEALRRSVALSWAEQTLGVDIDGPAASEVAEACVWQARRSSVDGLAAALEELEGLAVAAGIVTQGSVALLRAPVEIWLDHMGALGVADARVNADEGGRLRAIRVSTAHQRGFERTLCVPEGADPLAALDLAVAALDSGAGYDNGLIDAALELSSRIFRAVEMPKMAEHPSVRVCDANSAPTD